MEKSIVIEILTFVIPVITFAMGYYLTNIGYKRERKLSIIREKFEKLYHPFYLMGFELGIEAEEGGLILDLEDGYVVKQLIDHLTKNIYLASIESQTLFMEVKSLYLSMMNSSDCIDEEKMKTPFLDLVTTLMNEYAECLIVLGYLNKKDIEKAEKLEK